MAFPLSYSLTPGSTPDGGAPYNGDHVSSNITGASHLNSNGVSSGGTPLFRATLDNVASLVTILRAIAFKDRANVIINSLGIRFIVEDSRASQGRAYVQANHFSRYDYPVRLPDDQDQGQDVESPDVITFSVDLQTLLDCLTIFGGSSGNPFSSGVGSGAGYGGFGEKRAVERIAVRITVPMDGHQMSLILEERGVVTSCVLTTYDPDPMTELHATFVEQRSICKVIMKSEWLKDAFSELDGTSDTITLLISPTTPYFRLSASGLAGDTQMDYPKDTDVVESFHCVRSTTNGYRYALLQPCLRALAVSSKCSIRVNEVGFLSIQFMINITEQDVTFVEYLVSPLADLGDD
ncbi:ssDNA endodeoxyribonuclease [Thoreauomyces humboldtii]|nr:ssDNA endodeoxyribonuclease [Thoreauomyces humboldtii]